MKSGFEQSEFWLRKWGLTPDGPEIQTATGWVLHVRKGSVPLALKLSETEEEIRGSRLMQWWQGVGAASVIEISGPALLMERAEDGRGLVDLNDEEAFPIIASVAGKLRKSHEEKPVPSGLTSLSDWFEPLVTRRHKHRITGAASDFFRQNLDCSQGSVVLHGDLHHGNILRFGSDYKVIDPKGLFGPPAFEFANALVNPAPLEPESERLQARLAILSKLTGIQQAELLGWCFVWSALSSVFGELDGNRKLARGARAHAYVTRDLLGEIGNGWKPTV